MKQPRAVGIAAIATMLIAGVAVAQDAGRRADEPMRGSSQTTLSGAPAARIVLADQLIGMDVTDRAGEKLGKIDDLVLDADGRTVSHAAIGYGGFLGIGKKRQVVPWHELEFSLAATEGRAGGSYGADASRSGSDRTSSISDDDDASRDRLAGERTDADTDWDVERRIVVNRSQEQFENGPTLDSWDDYEPAAGQPERRVSEILGAEIAGRADDDVGEIENLAIDQERGRIAYAIVDAEGNDWNLDSDTIAVPWRSLRAGGDGVFASDLDESAARQLGFRAEDARRLGERDYSERLHSAVGGRPVWEDDDMLARGDAGRRRDDMSGRVGAGGSHEGTNGRSDMSSSRGSAGTYEGTDGRSDASSNRGSAGIYEGTNGNRKDAKGEYKGTNGDRKDAMGEHKGTNGQATMVTFQGRIQSVTTGPSHWSAVTGGSPSAGAADGEHVHLKVETQDGRSVLVDAGHQNAMDSQSMKFAQGDQITVTGYRVGDDAMHRGTNGHGNKPAETGRTDQTTTGRDPTNTGRTDQTVGRDQAGGASGGPSQLQSGDVVVATSVVNAGKTLRVDIKGASGSSGASGTSGNSSTNRERTGTSSHQGGAGGGGGR